MKSFFPFALLSLFCACSARTGLRLPDVQALPDTGDAAPEPDAPVPCLANASLCDDHDVCTDDRCDPLLACVHTPVQCDDGDACTLDRCDPVLGCKFPPRDCNDNSACTLDRCDTLQGCLHEALACNDEDPCTHDSCDPQRGCSFTTFDCGGCADGLRDAFRALSRYPNIAGCAGGFALQGLNRETAPSCARVAGDDGSNPTGEQCNAADLCAEGWHVCRSDHEVGQRSPDGCMGAQDAAPEEFYATRQTGPGCGHCASGTATDCMAFECRADCAQTPATTNDIFGCGTLGAVPDDSSCHVLTRFSNNLCGALGAPWRCDGDPEGLRESDFVVKPGPARGGVLCCRD